MLVSNRNEPGSAALIARIFAMITSSERPICTMLTTSSLVKRLCASSDSWARAAKAYTTSTIIKHAGTRGAEREFLMGDTSFRSAGPIGNSGVREHQDDCPAASKTCQICFYLGERRIAQNRLTPPVKDR